MSSSMKLFLEHKPQCIHHRLPDIHLRSTFLEIIAEDERYFSENQRPASQFQKNINHTLESILVNKALAVFSNGSPDDIGAVGPEPACEIFHSLDGKY